MISDSNRRISVKIIIFILITNVVIAGYISYIVFKPNVISTKNNFPYSDSYALLASSLLKTQNQSDLGYVESLDLTVLSDNYPNGELSDQWGLSILIETNNGTVLIDTGPSYSTLSGNSLALNKDLSRVDFVVISHEHVDHIGGLSYVEEVNPGVTIYVPALIDNQTFNDLNLLDLNVIKINETTIIKQGFAIIGELNGPPYEQALVVNVKDVGLVSFMGCSHPGGENLIEKATTDLGYDSYMVIGGFHMHSAFEHHINDTIYRLIELGVKKIFPIHCSGNIFRLYMAEHYPQQYGQGNVGFQLTVNKFTINPNEPIPILFFIIISVLGISLIGLTGWFIRKKIVRKRA